MNNPKINEQELKIICCVPSCENALDYISKSDGAGQGISFYGFPSEVHLRAAWLRALGKQESDLPDSAVVCSLHFLNDDIQETESGLRQISTTSAIPLMVQVCMICLDTDSKLILMSKHKLEETYEKLTGYPLCDQGNLKQTLCVQCAQRLINFSRFRDKSLRARALMMDLVEKHQLITLQHIKMINLTKHQLKSSMVLTMLGPDHCDLHILEHHSEDKQTEIEEIGLIGEVKTEESDGFISVDGDMEGIYEEHNNVNDFVADPLKYESVPLQCTFCLEEFFHDHVYMQHMSVHLQNGDGECDTSQVCRPHTSVSSSSSHSSLITENKQVDFSRSAHAAQTTVVPPSASLVANDETNPTEAVDTNVSCGYKRLTDCYVKLYDIFATKIVQRQDVSLMKTQRDAMSCDNLNTVSEDFSYQATSQNEVPMTEYIKTVTNSRSRVKVIASQTLQSKTDDMNNIQCNNSSQYSSHTAKISYICDICGKNYKFKYCLVKHVRTHSEVNRLTCKICQHKCKYKSGLAIHMRSHTGEKPYTCNICNSKFSIRSSLVYHMRGHTGMKPYACESCEYKFSRKSHLKNHMRIHTGEKPYSCNICERKFTSSHSVVGHMSVHTGIKPYACDFCEYKSADKCTLKRHIMNHTGKPFICNICNRKFARNSVLQDHIKRIHTVIQPYTCKLCEFKCANERRLAMHMSIHTGLRPYACDLCVFTCSQKSRLVPHMRIHTGEKPYSCQKCKYKSAVKGGLDRHMRTHRGDNHLSRLYPPPENAQEMHFTADSVSCVVGSVRTRVGCFYVCRTLVS